MSGERTGIGARFARALAALGDLPSESRLVVALSGGSDSVALLSLLLGWRDRERPDVTLVAGHLDHRLRGISSSLDAEFCRGLAAHLGVRAIIEAEDVVTLAARGRLSIETAGRGARLSAFRRWAEREGARAVLTAHHRDDQVETILAHIRRGAGPRGLAGMPAKRPLAEGTAAELWRPCLSLSRSELAAHRSAAGLPHREDATNRSLVPARNRIRHRLLPALREALDPEIDERILALGAAAETIAGRLRRAVLPLLERARIRSPHAAIPAGTALRLRGEPALASALLIELWRGAQGRSGALTRDHHRAWRRLLEREEGGGHYDLPRGAALERAGEWILLLSAAPPPGPVAAPRIIPDRGEIPWRGARIRSGIGEESDGGSPSLIARLPGGPLAVRGAHPGDRLRQGGIGHRVGELLRSAGVPARWRGEYPVIVRGGAGTAAGDGEGARGPGEVLWIPGVRGPEGEGDRVVRVVRIIPVEEGDPIAFLLALRAERGSARVAGAPATG